MGFLDIFGGSIGGVAGSVVDFGLQSLANSVLPMSKAQRQMNEFNATEAAKARDFSAAQAEIERDWQEEQNAKYNSLQGKMQQAREAGVNPMLIAGGSAPVSPASVTSHNAAAPAAAGSAASPIGQISDMASAALGFSKLNAEINNIKASTRQMNGNALIQEIDALTRGEINDATLRDALKKIEVADVDIALKNAQVGEVAQRVLESQAEVAVKNAQLGEIASRISNLDADTNVKQQQLSEIASRIVLNETDADLKAAQILYVGAQTRSERLMSMLITENTHLSRAERKEINARIKKIGQQYDHDEIIYAFEEAVTRASSQESLWLAPKSELDAFAKWILERVAQMVTLGAYTGTYKNTTRSTSTNTNTTTVIDGNPIPSRNRVGY